MDPSDCKNSKIKRHRYGEAFKKEAVRQLFESKESVSAVARSMGVDRTNLQKWKQIYGNEFESPKSKARINQISTDIDLLKKEMKEMKETLNQLRNIVKKSFECKYMDEEKHPKKEYSNLISGYSDLSMER